MKPTNPRELAMAIASQVEGVDAAQVEQMFSVWQAVAEGDPVGTVRRDPQNGKVYVRCDCDGLPKWRVVDPYDGRANLFDLSNSVVWPILYRDDNLVTQENEVTAAVEAAIVPAQSVVDGEVALTDPIAVELTSEPTVEDA